MLVDIRVVLTYLTLIRSPRCAQIAPLAKRNCSSVTNRNGFHIFFRHLVPLVVAPSGFSCPPYVTMSSHVAPRCVSQKHVPLVSCPGGQNRNSCSSRSKARCRRGIQHASSSSSHTTNETTTERVLTLAERKQLLIRLCANTDRGKSASVETAAAIEAQVRAIEELNATTDPAVSPKISGQWSLIYTGASADAAARRAEKEGTIGSAITEVTGSSGNVAGRGASKDKSGTVTARSTGNARLASYLQGGDGVGGDDEDVKKPLGRTIGTLNKRGVLENLGNYQDIYLDEGMVENRAELKLLGVPVEIKIEASCVPVDAETTAEKVRLAVAFKRVALTFGKLPSLKIPLDWINNGTGPQGWLDTTFLDDDMRLGRGDKGSTFVTVRRG